MIAAEIANMRSGSSQGCQGGGRANDVAPIGATSTPATSIAEAADLMGVKRRSVQRTDNEVDL